MEPSPVEQRPIEHPAIEVGAALVTLVEPHEGHEASYDRWYERDHFYAGCLVGPGWFAGRRWQATPELKEMRFPTASTFLPDPAAGTYLATYWILAGYEAEAISWGSAQVRYLHDTGRMFAERDHVHTSMYVHRWSAGRDAEGVPSALALDHPFGGLVVIAVDRSEATTGRQLSGWLAEAAVPAAMAGTDWELTTAFTPLPLPPDAPVDQPTDPAQRARMLLLAFTGGHPRESWRAFEELAEVVDGSGLASIAWVAPFVPTIPGAPLP